METETAFSSSANSFILEKVLQEVKEVENRERHEEKEETSDSDLKFRPGFVHLLKDRFALLSIKSANVEGTDDDGPLKSSTNVFDLSDSNNFSNSRGISKSTDQLDGHNLSKRGSLQSPGSPERHINRINGSVAPSTTVSSRAFVRLSSKDSIESVSDLPVKGHPPSIHLYSRSTDSKTLDHIRSAGNKVIIIESTPKNDQTSKKANSVKTQHSVSNTDGSSVNENKSDEAWPVPNIVSSTRSLFEQSGKKRPAPSVPTGGSDESGHKSPQSPSSPVRNVATPVTPPTQILVHGQPIKVLQTTHLKSPTAEKVKPPSPAPRRSQAQFDECDSTSKSAVSSLKSSFLPSSNRSDTGQKNTLSNGKAESVNEEAVVTVSEARLMFDKGTPTSPKKSRSLVFPASNATGDSMRKPQKKSFAPPPPHSSRSNSAGPSSPKRQPLFKAASLPSVVPKPVNKPTSSVESSSQATARPSSVQSTSSRNDSSAWQTWDDIPKPKRRSFISEARRVDISKQQLSESRAKNKSFFFTVNEPVNKSPKLDDIPNDRTVTISVPKTVEADPINHNHSNKTPSQSRLAQETFWASYRDEDAESSNVDPELLGDYQKLMASIRGNGSTDSASIDRELEELPSTNIDDIMKEIEEARVSADVGPKTVGIRVVIRDKNKAKHKISFADGADLTSTYEYLSERAMIEELGISPDFVLNGGGELTIDDPASLFGLDDDDEDEKEETKKAVQSLPGKSAVTSGSLASYKSKYGANDYTWGQENEPASSLSTPRDVLDGDGLTEESQPLAEKSEQDEMNWSSATTADLLF